MAFRLKPFQYAGSNVFATINKKRYDVEIVKPYQEDKDGNYKFRFKSGIRKGEEAFIPHDNLHRENKVKSGF